MHSETDGDACQNPPVTAMAIASLVQRVCQRRVMPPHAAVNDLRCQRESGRSEEPRLTPVTNAHLVCRLLLEKKTRRHTNARVHWLRSMYTHHTTRNHPT